MANAVIHTTCSVCWGVHEQVPGHYSYLDMNNTFTINIEEDVIRTSYTAIAKHVCSRSILKVDYLAGLVDC